MCCVVLIVIADGWTVYQESSSARFRLEVPLLIPSLRTSMGQLGTILTTRLNMLVV